MVKIDERLESLAANGGDETLAVHLSFNQRLWGDNEMIRLCGDLAARLRGDPKLPFGQVRMHEVLNSTLSTCTRSAPIKSLALFSQRAPDPHSLPLQCMHALTGGLRDTVAY
jgi:hypothetical protein